VTSVSGDSAEDFPSFLRNVILMVTCALAMGACLRKPELSQVDETDVGSNVDAQLRSEVASSDAVVSDVAVAEVVVADAVATDIEVQEPEVSKPDLCVPWCGNMGQWECGSDGCGGSCGDCKEPEECLEHDVLGMLCFDFAKDCAGICDAHDAECGVLPAFGGDPPPNCECGACIEGSVCLGGDGLSDEVGSCCTIFCKGKKCGDDGCGGSCGSCDDNDLCTEEHCTEERKCKYTSVKGCCHEAEECDDENSCTEDLCLDNDCTYGPLEGPDCCILDGDCGDDENSCSLVSCSSDFVCEYTPADEFPCCTKHIDCAKGGTWDSGFPGTIGYCANYQCFYEDWSNFCSDDYPNTFPCLDDGDPCTKDVCVDGKCIHWKSKYDCCSVSFDCYDEDVCTKDICVDGKCHFEAIPGCCHDSYDCDDKGSCVMGPWCSNHECKYQCDQSCAEDMCFWDYGGPCYTTVPKWCGCQFILKKKDGCCYFSKDCPDDPCSDVYCGQDFECVYEPVPGCCEPDQVGGACDDGVICTCDLCDEGSCVHLHPGDWLPVCGAVPAGCCAVNEDCEDGNPSTVGLCTDDECNYFPSCESDEDCEGGNWCSVGKCDEAMSLCEYEPKFAGCCVQDDDCDDGDSCTVGLCELSAHTCYYEPDLSPGAQCCQWSDECGDDDPCTVDKCDYGKCVHKLKVAPCADDLDCVDDDVCTKDECVDCACQHTVIQGCCVSDLDCDVGVPCSVDKCESNQCQHMLQENCCWSQAQCDDGNPCTGEVCYQGFCLHYLPLVGLCDDGDPCTVGDACVAGECASGANECEETAECSGVSNACTGPLENLGGVCWSKESSVQCDKTLDWICEGAVCNPGTGQCEMAPRNPGGRCNDGNPETVNDICVEGECVGQFGSPECLSDVDCGGEVQCWYSDLEDLGLCGAFCMEDGICHGVWSPLVSDCGFTGEGSFCSYSNFWLSECVEFACMPKSLGGCIPLWPDDCCYDDDDCEESTVLAEYKCSQGDYCFAQLIGTHILPGPIPANSIWTQTYSSVPTAQWEVLAPDKLVFSTWNTPYPLWGQLVAGVLSTPIVLPADSVVTMAFDLSILGVNKLCSSGARMRVRIGETVAFVAKGADEGYSKLPILVDLSPWAGDTIVLAFEFDSMDCTVLNVGSVTVSEIQVAIGVDP
jgi:hypothetical protein